MKQQQKKHYMHAWCRCCNGYKLISKSNALKSGSCSGLFGFFSGSAQNDVSPSPHSCKMHRLKPTNDQKKSCEADRISSPPHVSDGPFPALYLPETPHGPHNATRSMGYRCSKYLLF